MLLLLLLYVLGAESGEALVTPLTYTYGTFERPPHVHERSLGTPHAASRWDSWALGYMRYSAR